MEKQETRKRIAERLERMSLDLWNLGMEIGREFGKADLMCMHAREITNSVTYILDECAEMTNPTEE